MIQSILLVLAVLAGELIKVPVSGLSGFTLLDVAVFLFCLEGIFQLKFRFKKLPKPFFLPVLFILIGCISLISSPFHLSINQITVSALYGVRFLMFLFFGYLLYCGALSEIKKNLLSIFIFSGVGLALLGLIQLILIPNLSFLAVAGWDPHYLRTVSTFLDPNFLGAFLALALLPLSLFIFEEEKMPSFPFHFSPAVFKIFFLIVYFALITTFSRSAAICFGASFLLLSILTKSKKIFLLTIVMALGFGISYLSYRHFVSTPRNINRTASAEFRLSDWQEGLKIFQYSPVFGVGFNSYQFALSKLNLASTQAIQSRGGTSNDSSLLFVADTTGILGFLVFLDFLLQPFKKAYHLKNTFWGTYVFAGLGGIIANSFFINSLFYPFFLFWIFAGVSQLFSDNSR